MRIAWLEGEQEAFAGKPGRLSGAAEERAFELLLDALDKRQPARASEIARLSDDKLLELAQELAPATCDVATMKLLLGRLGEGFGDQAVSLVKTGPALLEAAMPIEASELVRVAATALHQQKLPSDEDAEHYALSAAESWLVRHGDFAARELEALAKHELRDAFGCALAYLAARGLASSSDWLAPFAELAPIVARDPALAVLVARDERDRVAARVGEEPAARRWLEKGAPAAAKVAPLPAFFAALPRPVLQEGDAMSDAELRAFGVLLRDSSLAHPHPEIAKVRFRCDRASLDAFAVALLSAWCDVERREGTWPLEACATIGGDAAAREVARRVRSWSRSRGYSEERYAKLGCSVLAAQAQHGSEIARVLLGELKRVGGRASKEAARLVSVVDVTSQEEEKIPTLGLDADGSATFDLGGDTYRIAFDEGLSPSLVDSSGARLDSFPRLRKGANAKLWAAAKARYAGMVKDAKTVARHELALLERAMCNQEAMPAAAFRERFIEHPFMHHVGMRLVWSTSSTFRVTEDRSFANEEDKAVTLVEGDVRVAHPARMTAAEKQAWLERFVDYEIVQPFPQLARETFAQTPEDRGEHTIKRLPTETKTSRGRIFQLVSRGWAHEYDRIERELGGSTATIRFTGPIGAWSDEYSVDYASCSDALHLLDPVTYSELMRDAEYLAGR